MVQIFAFTRLMIFLQAGSGRAWKCRTMQTSTKKKVQPRPVPAWVYRNSKLGKQSLPRPAQPEYLEKVRPRTVQSSIECPLSWKEWPGQDIAPLQVQLKIVEETLRSIQTSSLVVPCHIETAPFSGLGVWSFWVNKESATTNIFSVI